MTKLYSWQSTFEINILKQQIKKKTAIKYNYKNELLTKITIRVFKAIFFFMLIDFGIQKKFFEECLWLGP
jgi:hypothetical protein